MLFKKEEVMLSYNVIKFRDNVDFDLEEDNLREVFRSSKRYPDNTWLIKYKGVIEDLDSGVTMPIEFTLGFYGFFKEKIKGKLWGPEGIKPTDYDMFVKLKPYVLKFDPLSGVSLPLEMHKPFQVK